MFHGEDQSFFCPTFPRLLGGVLKRAFSPGLVAEGHGAAAGAHRGVGIGGTVILQTGLLINSLNSELIRPGFFSSVSC